MGAFLDGEWESISKLFTVEESPDLFLEYYSPSKCSNEIHPDFSAANNRYSTASLNGLICSGHSHNDSSSEISGAENFVPDILSCIDFSNMSDENDGSLGISLPNVTDIDSQTYKRKSEDETNSVETEKKNDRNPKVAQKGKRKADSKSDAVIKDCNKTPDSNSGDSNVYDASEEMNATEDSNSNTNVCVTSTGKKRASRGAATDPQSLYARKRRMRINERLRILQSLVPNGTKVDISTMLEEAFHYVKFLQLQIRMLSSDDLWMYAPLAYNGLEIGAYKRLPHPFHGL